MSESYEQISTLVEEATMQYCQAEHEKRQGGPIALDIMSDESLYSRTTNCGKATAFVQHQLRENEGIDVDRLYGEPSEAPRQRYTNRVFGHVILSHNQYLIDPTYGQLFTFAGIDPNGFETTPDDYPVKRSLVVDVNRPEQTLDPLIESLHEATYREHARESMYAPLREIGRRRIADIVENIYDLEQYSSFEVSSSDPGYEYHQRLLTIARQLQNN